MKYCKKCVCGHVNVYEGASPFKCGSCGRNLMRVRQEEYVPEEEQKEEKPPVPAEHTAEKDTPVSAVPENDEPDKKEEKKTAVFVQKLESPDGTCVIPVDGTMIIGRNSEGKEYLKWHEDVSREHFVITPRPNGIAATVKDISSFGTYINGKRMQKESSAFITDGATIRLASDAVLKFTVKEV